MDEMTQVRELRADTPTPDRARLAPGRQRLADAAAKSSRGRALRTDWRLAALGAAAAAVVAVLIGVQLQGSGADSPAASDSRVSTVPDLEDPVALLNRIADAAATRPDPNPKAGQWVYKKTYDGMWEENAPPPDVAEEMGVEHVGPERESWDRYADPEFENWKEGDDHSYREIYEFLEDLPADPEKAFAKLRKFYPSGDGGFEESRNAHNARAAGVLAGIYPAPPEGMARLYRAMATLEGVSVVDHLVKDATGQKAIAVYVEPEGREWTRNDMLFDPQTLEYVGSRVIATADDPFEGDEDHPIAEEDRVKKGDVMIDSAILRTAMVAEKGQRP